MKASRRRASRRKASRQAAICLALETTGDHLGVALVRSTADGADGAETLGLHYSPQTTRQSDTLMPTVEEVLRAAGVKRAALSLIAVDIGPGSFTGVRVGVSAGRAIAQGLQIPLVGVSSLEAMAWAASQRRPPARLAGARTLVSCFPALAGDVYFAVYRASVKAPAAHLLTLVRRPAWKTVAAFDWDLKKVPHEKESLWIAGDRLATVRAAMPARANLVWDEDSPPHPDTIARLALMRSRQAVPPFERVVPLYLQPMWAERVKAGL